MIQRDLICGISRPFSSLLLPLCVSQKMKEKQQEYIEKISPRLNTILLGIDPQYINSIFFPYTKNESNFLSKIKEISLKSYNKPHSLVVYNKADKSFNSIKISNDALCEIGKYALNLLAQPLNDVQRIYAYKLLFTFFENCIDRVDEIFIVRYSAQICKEEVGFQLITNLLFVLGKLKGKKEYYDLMLKEILSKKFISLFIMYKTWRNVKIREKVHDLLDLTKDDLFNLEMQKEKFCSMTNDLKNEIELLESLRDHICIRLDMQNKLKTIFN